MRLLQAHSNTCADDLPADDVNRADTRADDVRGGLINASGESGLLRSWRDVRARSELFCAWWRLASGALQRRLRMPVFAAPIELSGSATDSGESWLGVLMFHPRVRIFPPKPNIHPSLT